MSTIRRSLVPALAIGIAMASGVVEFLALHRSQRRLRGDAVEHLPWSS